MGYMHHSMCTYVRVTTSHKIAFAERFLICAIGTITIPTIEVVATANIKVLAAPNILSAVFTITVPTMAVTIIANVKLLLVFFMSCVFGLTE